MKGPDMTMQKRMWQLLVLWLRAGMLILPLAWAGACVTAPSDDDDSAGDDDDAGDDDGGDDDAGDDDSTPNIGPSGEFTLDIEVDGITRDYSLYVPDSATAAMEDGPVPVLIALHGAGDTGASFIHAIGMTGTADANGFVLVGPEGYNHGWFVETAEGWPGTDGNDNSFYNDLAFMQMLLDETGASYHIDPDRVYAVGHSRGAGFTGMTATLSGGTNTVLGPYESPFAAYGVNAGYDAFGGGVDLSLASPKRPIWVIHGTSDTNVPYDMGESFADALDAAGWDVTFTPVSGAGHSWLWRSQYGQTNQDLWDYFESHPAN
jgi:poly(3-hydroxybutyrate) depolymerase